MTSKEEKIKIISDLKAIRKKAFDDARHSVDHFKLHLDNNKTYEFDWLIKELIEYNIIVSKINSVLLFIEDESYNLSDRSKEALLILKNQAILTCEPVEAEKK